MDVVCVPCRLVQILVIPRKNGTGNKTFQEVRASSPSQIYRVWWDLWKSLMSSARNGPMFLLAKKWWGL